MSDPSATLRPFVEMACDAIHREYPVALITSLKGPEDLKLPRDLTPAFYGSFDWHSAVHTHWTLVRALRLAPDASWAPRARQALARTLTREALEREHAFLFARPGFERPYGLAWLLMLAAETRALAGAFDEAAIWREGLAPLETLASDRLVSWATRLPYPVRSGEHSQSAFALGLAMDWAHECDQPIAHASLAAAVRRLHMDDVAAPIAYEPSGQDFLSPILGAADAMRRALEPVAFAEWLERYLPVADDAELERWLTPATPPDRSDGKFAHLDGLNLSRAWMLEGIAAALPAVHALRASLEHAADRHATAGLDATRASGDWMGTHWLASFAVYLTTRRGIRDARA